MALNYDEIFVSANKAQKTINKTEIVLDILRHAKKPMTCKEIGTAIMGKEYSATKERKFPLGKYEYTYHGRSHEARSWTSFIGRVLTILTKKGIVEAKEIDGEPITVEREDWISNPDAPPEKITVHDAEGNEYQMPNPQYDYKKVCSWGIVKQTITPKIRVYSLVG